MEASYAGQDLIALYVQLFGTLAFCLVFLYLWRQSGIVYFGLWSLAWAAQTLSLPCGFHFFRSHSMLWLAPYASLQFAFALSLLAAGRAGLERPKRDWNATVRLAIAFVAFLAAVYLFRIYVYSLGYRWLHELVLSLIYLYNYASIRVSEQPGGKLFRFTLLGLSLAFLYQGLGYAYLHLNGAELAFLTEYLPYHGLLDFGLHMLLAFTAMAVWIENQNHRVRELRNEVERVRLESESSQDVDRLTGLKNQAALSRGMEEMRQFTGVVAVCDMDNFKDVNDSYGHLVGDEILRGIGHLLRASIRSQDEAFRWGGDEFVILFHGQSEAVVGQRMIAIEKRLRTFRVRGHGVLPISFSWGMAEGAGDPLRDRVDEADRRMYERKRGRRGDSGLAPTV